MEHGQTWDNEVRVCVVLHTQGGCGSARFGAKHNSAVYA